MKTKLAEIGELESRLKQLEEERANAWNQNQETSNCLNEKLAFIQQLKSQLNESNHKINQLNDQLNQFDFTRGIKRFIIIFFYLFDIILKYVYFFNF